MREPVSSPACTCYAVAVGLSVLGSPGGLLAASLFLLLGDGPRQAPAVADQLRGRHAAGRGPAGAAAGGAGGDAAGAALGTLLAGILVFFLLEKLVLWRHCHDADECDVHTSSAASLVIIGDAFHTFVDGAVIAAAVVTSVPLGITTALAVATHEIPQEVGDVAILLRAGFSRRRAFTLNLLAGVGGILGAVAMIAATEALPSASVRPRVCGRQLPLRGDGRPHPRPPPRRPRGRARAPAPPDRRRYRHIVVL